MSTEETKVVEYIQKTRYAVLATVENGGPVQRTIGAFGNEGTTVYFATQEGSRKVHQIAEQPKVSVLLQHEGQALAAFVNIAIRGKAIRLSGNDDLAKAVEIIGSKSERFRKRIEENGLAGQVLYRIEPDEVRQLDLSRGGGAAAVTVLPTTSA